MLTLYRRHLRSCVHRSRSYKRCSCPLWVQGIIRDEIVRKSLSVRNWEAGQRIVREWEAGGPAAIVNLGEAVERFLADKKTWGIGSEQYEKYKLTLKRLEKWSDNALVLTPDEIAKFLESHSVSVSTKRSILGRLRAFYSFCVERGWVKENPAKKIRPSKEHVRQVQPFSDSEMEEIMFALDLYKDWPKGRRAQLKAFVLMLRYTGLRIRDVVQFRKANLQGERIFVNTQKAKTTVGVPVPKEVVEALKAIEGISEYYFWSGNGLPKTCVADWQRSLTKLFKLAGVENGHAHRFRHSFSTKLLSQGVSLENVAKILGNTARVVEKHYSAWIHSRQEALAEEVQRTWSVSPK